jgi:hypothetical protein
MSATTHSIDHYIDPNKLPPHAAHAPHADNSDYSETEEPVRAPGETSPTASLYDHDDTLGSIPQDGKVFSFFHTASHIDFRIIDGVADLKTIDPSRDATMYVSNSYKPGSPSVTLCQGNEKSGQVLGVAETGIVNYKVGLGSPPHSAWSEMKRHGLVHKTYWSFNFQDQEFKWKRTHDKSLGAGPSMRNKKLVDGMGNALAVYQTNQLSGWKKMGRLIIMKDLGNEWQLLVLLTFLVLLEKERRVRRGGLVAMRAGASG